MTSRAFNLKGQSLDDALTPSPRFKQPSGNTQVATRKCCRCRKRAELIVLYRNAAAVEYCAECWQYASPTLKQKAVNVVAV